MKTLIRLIFTLCMLLHPVCVFAQGKVSGPKKNNGTSIGQNSGGKNNDNKGKVKPHNGEKNQVRETKGIINGHEYVDLGLPSGLKWATCNVGASSPSDYGSYFAWGETFTKGEYTESNCRTYDRTFGDISGNVGYDAARANWGGSWRMPTKTEYEELLNNCQWTFITMGDHNGYKVIGPNGNYIFLPAAGYRNGAILDNSGSYGSYWSSSPYDTKSSYELYFSSSSRGVGWSGRRDGQSVRAVTE